MFPEPSGSFAAAAAKCGASSDGKYKININLLSTASDQQRVSLVRRLAAKDSSIDILAMDVDWTAEFATAKWIRPWPAALAAQVTQGDLAGPIATATWNNQLYAGPINSNTQLLWYRKDLVPTPPTTWTRSPTRSRGGLAPVAASVYDDPSIAKQYPFHALLRAQIQHYGIRPKTPAYADVSLAIQKSLSPTSSIIPSSLATTLEDEIKKALSSGALL